jgi:TolB-like protein/tetratricopeptide (TPR) repeat protein
VGASVDEPALVTLPGTVLGTTAYMSPEQVSGRRVDARTDVFALGIIFYEALAGTRPFAGVDLQDVREQIVHKTPLPLTEINRRIPPDIEALVRRCLEKAPADRFGSAIDLQQELTTLVRLRTGSSPSAGEAPESRLRSHRIDSLAVLPFDVSSSDPDSEYLGDGISEDLIRDLARVPGVRVKSRSIVQRYRGQHPTPAALGTELGVTAVVMGKVAKRGDRLSVIVEFVRCEDESLLWSDRLTRGADQLLAIEDELLHHLVKEISARLADSESPTPARRHTPSADAHGLYLRGRASWNQRTPDSLRRAIAYFQQAVEADPEYGLAFAGLADAYTALGFYDLVPPSDVMPRAKAAASRALETDPDLPEGHASLGLVSSIWDFNWDESGRRLRKALDLNASLAYVHHWYAMQLSTLGRGDEAYAEIKRALELDPLSTAAQGDALNVLIRARRFDEGIREARRALALDSTWTAGWAALGRALQYNGAPVEALEAFERAAALSPDSVRTRALLAAAYGAAGRVEDARRLRDALTRDAERGYVPAFWRAVVAHGLGQTTTTLDLLEQAFAERYPQVAYLAVEPAFDPLRTHPRFLHLTERIGVGQVIAGKPAHGGHP